MSEMRIEKIHVDEAVNQNMEGFSLQEKQDFTPPTGLALHQVFDRDILHELLSQSTEVETITPSLWQRIFAWFTKENKGSTLQKSESKTIAGSKEIKPEAISPIPVLDMPETHVNEIPSTKLPSISKKDDLKTRLTSSDIEEAFSLMSEQSIEAIMFIIFKLQIQLEKENANAAESTFSKYLDFQKHQQQILGEIKDALVNDEAIVKRFGTAQNIAVYMAGIAAFAAGFGLLGPVWSFLSTATTAGLTAVTLGGKAYFQRLMNDHQAKHEDYAHYDQYYNNRIDDSRNRLMGTAEADTIFKERWIQFLRRSDKMRKLVFKK